MRINNFHKNFRFAFVLLLIAFLTTTIVVDLGIFVLPSEAIQIGSVSPKRFKATREIENKIATDALRQKASASVAPIYQTNLLANDEMFAQLDGFFAFLGNKRAEYMPIYNPSAEESESEDNFIWETSESPISLTENQFEYLVTLGSNQYNQFKLFMTQTIVSIVEEGVKPESLTKSIEELNQTFKTSFLNASEQEIANQMVSSILRPNLVLDEDATANLKNEKANAIEPIVYYKGQNIVNEGDPITKEAYYALEQLGFVNKGFSGNLFPLLGSLVFIALVFFAFCFYCYRFYPQILNSRGEISLLFSLFMLTIVSVKIFALLPFYFIPLVFFALLVSALLNTKLSLVLSILTVLLAAVTSSADLAFVAYFVVNVVFAAILAEFIFERNFVFYIGVALAFCGGLTVLSIHFVTLKTYDKILMDNMVYAICSGLLSVVVAIGTMPLWETLFGILTPNKLLDLTNPNKPLLRRLIIEAPGTYQHSLIVANLAETACFDIGANAILARVGAYYHDIGKLEYPKFFVENQLGANPHDTMPAQESARTIISHTAYGLELAQQAKLPVAIQEFISQHHGNSLMKYFYTKAQKAHPDEMIDEKTYHYQNPVPCSREIAIVMLADTVEAAVRSMPLEEKTQEKIEAFVGLLIKDKLNNGQLKNSNLTINNLDTIAHSFMRVFNGMNHERVSYPSATATK